MIPGATNMKIRSPVSYIQNTVYDSTLTNMATAKKNSEFIANNSIVDRMCTKEKRVRAHTHTHTRSEYECDLPLPVKEWPHPARRLNIMEIRDSTPYSL